MGLFQQLHDAGQTIVMITHDQAVARLASQVVQIRDGAIVEDRPAAAWRTRLPVRYFEPTRSTSCQYSFATVSRCALTALPAAVTRSGSIPAVVLPTGASNLS